MISVLAIAALILIAGRVLRLDRRVQVSLLIILFVAVVFFQLTLPADNPLRLATGGSINNWLILGAIAAVVLGYRAILQRARTTHDADQPVEKEGTFSDAELDRYARHIVLREVGGPGQKKLKSSSVLVIGAGGLGSPALQYLAAAGIGTLGVIDDDDVENSNLQRQIIHEDARIGMPKVFSAVEALKAQNPFVTLRPYHRRLDPKTAKELFTEYDLILDGTDNFETRYMVNAASVALEKPLISAAITQWEGQISLYHPAAGAPCYACAFPVEPDRDLAPSCAEAGVVGALPGVVGAMMAMEAIKYLTGAGETLAGRLMLYDALYAENRTIKIAIDPACKICGHHT